MEKWTKFKDGKPSPESKIIVKYPSGVEGFGEWGKTFKENIDPEAKWYELPKILEAN